MESFRKIDIMFIEFHGPNKIEKSNILVDKIKKEFATIIYKEYSPGKYELFKIK